MNYLLVVQVFVRTPSGQFWIGTNSLHTQRNLLVRIRLITGDFQ